MSHRHSFTRRDFLRLSGLGLGAAALASCEQRVKVTAIPPPTRQPAPLAPAGQPAPLPTGQSAPPTQALVSGQPADVVLVNGNIVTMDSARSTAKMVAIQNGLILSTGDEAAARAVTGGATQIIDLHGRTVTPGLIDAHCHLSACGLLGTLYVDVNWPAINTIQQMQARVAERVASTPAGEWVLGAGWVGFDGRFPNKHDVDPVSPRNPVMLINQGGHFAVVNSLALEMAGVNASTPDPGNGRFLREANGEPDGTVMNHPAMDYFRKLWPPDLSSQAVMEASILSPQAKFASMGVTSFQDVYARDMDRMAAYFSLGSRGAMTIRGQIMNALEYIQELEGRIDAIEAMRFESDYMHFAGGKFQVDGAGEASFTHEPHDGIAWNISIWKPDDLKQVVRAFHDAGYQVALHAFGDAAVDMGLDAIEAAMNANPRSEPRHRIEHSILNTAGALQRTKDLGIVISTQPQMIRAFGDAFRKIWGEERMQRMAPTRTWLDMGVPVCLGSDAPSMPWWDPQTTLAASVLRYTLSNQVVSPDQAMTVEEAMYAHTMVGAYADFAEAKKGSLEPGKLADVIVWHDNPYSVKPVDILKLTIDLTMVGGKVVHQA